MGVDINYDFGCKLVEGNPGKYQHSFGGDFRYDGLVPDGCPMPVHLVFRLDMADPVLPFRIDADFRFLPFFQAFRYEASPMSYRVLSDTEIEILSLERNDHIPDFPYPEFPQYLDFIPMILVPISYEEQRDITMNWFVYEHKWLYNAIPSDEIQKFKNRGYPVTRIGCVHNLIQLPRGECCPNPACENHNVRFCLHTIATVPEKPARTVDLWRSDGQTIQIVYEICNLCSCIRTYNTCD